MCISVAIRFHTEFFFEHKTFFLLRCGKMIMIFFYFFELHFTADANCERDTRNCFAFDSFCIYRHELRARCVCVILAKFQLIGRLTGTGTANWRVKFT